MAAGNAAGMWWVLSLCWGLFAFTGLVWVAARAAAALTGGHVPPFGERWVTDLISLDDSGCGRVLVTDHVVPVSGHGVWFAGFRG